MKKWKILNEKQANNPENILKMLLSNRGLKTKEEIEEFLYPKLEEVTINAVGIDKKDLQKTLKRIQKAINKNETIIIFGDYDVDGICGTAIIWETIHEFYKNVIPYIPDRFEEGYGLSINGINNVLDRIRVEPSKRSNPNRIGLIITVDNGIVAYEAVEYANEKGIDVIITDHHTIGEKMPDAYSFVHTTKLCGTGVAYLLSQEISNFHFSISNDKHVISNEVRDPHGSSAMQGISHPFHGVRNDNAERFLDLVALATVADLVPLVGANRTLVKFGLEALRKTERLGLKELINIAGIQKQDIGVYEIGHVIGPRLNAAGRLFSAMDALRLICTTNRNRAFDLAIALDQTNKERQLITQQTADHASLGVSRQGSEVRRIVFVHHDEYNEGIIGLVASRLVEQYYRPAFVIARGEKISKGSARSIKGVNIIEMIRSVSGHVVQAGGHPMAAGFTVETERIEELRMALEKHAETVVLDEHLLRELLIDMPLDFSDITFQLIDEIQKLSPFGMGNPEPVFITRNVQIEEIRTIGKDAKHLKLKLSHCPEEKRSHHNCVAFGIGDRFSEFAVGNTVDVVYTVSEDTWQGAKKLQLKIKDIKPN